MLEATGISDPSQPNKEDRPSPAAQIWRLSEGGVIFFSPEYPRHRKKIGARVRGLEIIDRRVLSAGDNPSELLAEAAGLTGITDLIEETKKFIDTGWKFGAVIIVPYNSNGTDKISKNDILISGPKPQGKKIEMEMVFINLSLGRRIINANRFNASFFKPELRKEAELAYYDHFFGFYLPKKPYEELLGKADFSFVNKNGFYIQYNELPKGKLFWKIDKSGRFQEGVVIVKADLIQSK